MGNEICKEILKLFKRCDTGVRTTVKMKHTPA